MLTNCEGAVFVLLLVFPVYVQCLRTMKMIRTYSDDPLSPSGLSTSPFVDVNVMSKGRHRVKEFCAFLKFQACHKPIQEQSLELDNQNTIIGESYVKTENPCS